MKKKLPSSKEEAVELLKARVEAGECLTLEELALVLWHLGTIDVTPRHDLVAHRLYTGLPDCPAYFDPRQLEEELAVLLGQDLGLAYLRNACLETVVITGVPEGGVALAQGVFKAWPPAMAKLVPMSEKEDGTGFCFDASASFGGGTVLIVDNAASTGTTVKQATLAVKEREGKVRDILVLVDRQEGAQELLQQLPEPPRLIAAINMSTVVEVLARHELIAAEIPAALAAYRGAVLEAIRIASGGLACNCEVCQESQD